VLFVSLVLVVPPAMLAPLLVLVVPRAMLAPLLIAL
jgi:hypothetical protein